MSRSLYPVLDSAPLEVTLYTKEEVQAAIDKLKEDDKYTRILHHEDIVSVADEQTNLTEMYQNCWEEHRKTAAEKEVLETIEDQKFQNLKGLPDVSRAGVCNMQEMCVLMEYLFMHGCHTLKRVKDGGSCLYASIRRCTTIGRECSNTHLRRHLVMKVCENHEFFFNLLKVAIAQEYGSARSKPRGRKKKKTDAASTAEDDDHQTPGPLSFCSLLEHILKRESWGDKIVILLFSFIWQIRITILMTPDKDELRVRHNLSLKDSNLDMVLVLGGTNHFSGTG